MFQPIYKKVEIFLFIIIFGSISGKYKNSYKAPAQKRQKIKITVLVANPEMKENKNPPNEAAQITFWRPQVSAKNPQKCEVHTMPKKETELKIPCSVVDKFKSHLAYGKM